MLSCTLRRGGRALWCALVLCAAGLHAEESTAPELKKQDAPPAPTHVEVEVTADKVNKTDTPAPEPSLTVPSVEAARAQIQQTPGGVEVLDAEAYKRGRATTLADVFQWSPGVTAQSRFGTEEARLSIRGSGVQRTFHGRGIKLLQDGIPVNQADGGFDFQDIEPLAAEYVEVYRGANALAHGGTTLGGAINFISKTGHTADKVQARVEAGSYGTVRSQLSSGMVIGKVDYYFSATKQIRDGMQDHSHQTNYRAQGNVGLRINENLETRFYATYAHSDSQLPGSLTKDQLYDDREQASFLFARDDAKRDLEVARGASKTTYRWGDQRLEASLYYVYKDLHHPLPIFVGIIDQLSNDFGAHIRYVNEANLGGRRNHFTAGVNPAFGYTTDRRFVTLRGSAGAPLSDQRTFSVNLDFFAENQHYVLDNLAVVAGAQASYAKRRFDDRFPVAVDNPDSSETRDYFAFNPKVGVRWDWWKSAQLFFNVSRSFEPPSFGELTPRGAGLTPLLDQNAWTMEIGTRGSHGRFAWDFAYYHAWLDHELLTLVDPAGTPLGTVNAERTVHQGIELGFDVELFSGLAAHAKDDRPADRILLRQLYNWSDFRFADDRAYGDNELAGLPEHFYRAEIVYEHPVGFYAGPNVEWVPQKWAVDHANTLYADAYAVLGFKAGYRNRKGFSAFFEARNLTDRAYANTTGVVNDARIGFGPPAAFSPGDGRSFYVGLEWKW